jgi:hypothetical protein
VKGLSYTHSAETGLLDFLKDDDDDDDDDG